MTYHNSLNPRRRQMLQASRRHRMTDSCAPLAVFGAVGALFLGGLGFSILNATHVEEHTCTVTEKDRTKNSDGSSDARIYTEDCGTLRVGDSLLSWTWSSADTFGQIDEGERYHFTTRGFRVPFFSMFPNVVEVEEVR